MKYKSLRITLLVALSFCANLSPLSAREPVEGNIYWIGFSDRGEKNSLSNVSLSEKALARRLKYGIGLTENDFPVNQAYIEQLAQLGGEVLGVSRWLNGALVSVGDESIIARINLLPFVVDACDRRKKKNKSLKKATDCLRTVVDPVRMEADSAYGDAGWQIAFMGGEALHHNSFRGKGIAIAVLDEGFYGADRHPAFDSLRASGRLLGYRDFSMREESFFDYERSNHGTKVLSCMAANMPGSHIGTAPEASYWLLSSEHGRKESPIEEYFWAFAAEFADSVGVDIITSSLGYAKFDDPSHNYYHRDFYKYRSPTSQAAACAWQKGIIVLVSAGNDGNTAWQYHLFPGETPEVITVGAVDAKGQVAKFSSKGYPNRKLIKPDIVAPGKGVLLTDGTSGYVLQDGTSYATPLVAGLAACLLQLNPELTNNEIKRLLRENATHSATPNHCYGYGVPNFEGIMSQLRDKQKSSRRKLK